MHGCVRHAANRHPGDEHRQPAMIVICDLDVTLDCSQPLTNPAAAIEQPRDREVS